MGTHPIFESDFDCLTDLSRTTWRFVKNICLGDCRNIITGPNRSYQVTQAIVMPKQSSISSFFKPKTANVADVSKISKKVEKEETKSPKKLKKEVKVGTQPLSENKENFQKVKESVAKMAIDEKSDNSDDDDVIKPNR